MGGIIVGILVGIVYLPLYVIYRLAGGKSRGGRRRRRW